MIHIRGCSTPSHISVRRGSDISTRIVLTAAGDIVVRHRLFEQDRLLHPPYQKTIDFMASGDLAWGSCEVQFSERGFRTDSLVAYLVEPEVALDLGRAGFDVMTVATNHTWDFGPDAFLDTLENLRRGGITSVGGGSDLDQALSPVVFERNGMKLGIVAVSCLLPPYYAATAERPGIAPLRVHQSHRFDPLRMMIEPSAPLSISSSIDNDDWRALTDQIEALESQVDFVLVSVHWGYGRGEPLADYQQPLGRALIDAGAHMVLGNHTHSPSGIELHEGRPIIYGLGNHIAQQDRTGANEVQKAVFADIDEWSSLARFTLAPGRVERIEVIPTWCDESGLPIPITDAKEAGAVLGRIARLSGELGTRLEVDGLAGEVVLAQEKG
ncbi:MAG: CapA family protein [Trueperaceae bacterium]